MLSHIARGARRANASGLRGPVVAGLGAAATAAAVRYLGPRWTQRRLEAIHSGGRWEDGSVLPSANDRVLIAAAALSLLDIDFADAPAVLLGADRHLDPCGLDVAELAGHGIVTGACGTGHTVTLETLILAMADLDWDGVVLDMRADLSEGGLRDFCEYAGASTFRSVLPTDLADPLSGLDAAACTDVIVSLLASFDDPYWVSVNAKVVSEVLELMAAAHAVDPDRFAAPTIAGVADVLAGPHLTAATADMVKCVEGTGSVVAFSSLQSPSVDEQRMAAGLAQKLRDCCGDETAAPLGDMTAGGVSYVGVDAIGAWGRSRLMSSAVLHQALAWVAQRTQDGYDRRAFVVVDEAFEAHRPLLVELLRSAEAGGVTVVLSVQSPCDFDASEGAEFAEMAALTNFTVSLSAGTSVAADLLADRFGDLVHGDDLLDLELGEAILGVDGPTPRVTWLAVKPK